MASWQMRGQSVVIRARMTVYLGNVVDSLYGLVVVELHV
jgi:hypothetical protein